MKAKDVKRRNETYLQFLIANFSWKLVWIDIKYFFINQWLYFKFYAIRKKYFPMWFKLILNNTLKYPLTIDTLKRISE